MYGGTPPIQSALTNPEALEASQVSKSGGSTEQPMADGERMAMAWSSTETT